ncbi:unnamed protein product [Didymodactylos carnosus]|uniref:Uncharacterized protein n=1 Tax=Didymodactylos carnosus TaxID=1234261 RepID=A0A814NHQ8_9BILA|nr:unnamed protein product [Didymodactylos carnosus]CAF1092098.1 unnamed protein product [Didymodactylos carnosus]CAF3643449.1 unnamed protein product [Didymodactylos carnosus]CAF3857575.1 unnamed protein product [Didymodactylos carnosus]
MKDFGTAPKGRPINKNDVTSWFKDGVRRDQPKSQAKRLKNGGAGGRCCTPKALYYIFASVIAALLIIIGILVPLLYALKQSATNSIANTTASTTTAYPTGNTPCLSISPANTTTWGNGFNNTYFGQEHYYVNKSCSSPIPTLTVVQAFYGLNNASICSCRTMDVSVAVRNNCTTSNCNFQVENALLNDTCVGQLKVFWMYYTCT